MLSVSLKMIAGVAFLVKWYSYRRDSMLLWGFFFLLSGFSVFADLMKNPWSIPLAQALGVSFLALGVVSLLSEENITLPPRLFRRVCWGVPLTVSLYILLYTAYSTKYFGPNLFYLAYGVSGIFYTTVGVVLLEVREIYPGSGSLLGAIVFIHGVHKMDYPFLRPVLWFAPIGFALGALLNAIEAMIFLRLLLSERFLKPERELGGIESGVFLVPPKTLNRYVIELSDFPVLAFTRKTGFPESWEVHTITTLPGAGNIAPTQLHRILERARSYLAGAHREGSKGVVVIDCFEYLMMYSDFRSVLKFLATLADYTVLYEGTLVITVDDDSLEERELRILRLVLNAGD